MKKYILLAFCCSITGCEPISADTQDIDFSQVQQKIANKEDFYLLVSRRDSLDTQKSLHRIGQVEQTIFYLDTRRIDYPTYRKFAKKYQIKSTTHLGYSMGKSNYPFRML